MKRALAVVASVVLLGACAGSDTVVTVNGVDFDLDDIPIETDASTVDLDTFRNALNWVIRDQVLVTAAAEEFGISFDNDELTARANSALEGLTPSDRGDPRANLDYFLIQARVGVGAGLLWPELETLLPEGTSANEWAIDKLRAADVEVDTRYGEWRTTPDPLVYGP